MNVKKESARFDLLSLGEVMLRLDPGNLRIRTARQFDVWEGGGEYNVARGLHKCFGLKTGIITGLADNEIGWLVENLISAGGVNTENICWKEFDGVGRDIRNGLNFTERGYGLRGAVGVSDRGHTAVSQLSIKDFDWERIFKNEGSRWLHTGGIFAALSKESSELAHHAIEMARLSETPISYDLNYRASLWKSIGGKSQAQKINHGIASKVNVLIGNEEDFEVALGIEIARGDKQYRELNMDAYREMIKKTAAKYQNLDIIAVTLRTVTSASRNDWSALAWSRDEGFSEGKKYQDLEIFDRVGGGDSFASGLIYGILQGERLQKSLELGLAHGALAMTTPGDTSMATLSEVLRLADGGNARVIR